MTSIWRGSNLLQAAGFRHAFFTRRGGVSEGAYASLNFAASNGDQPANVLRNVVVAEEALGVAPGRLYFVSQVHGVASVNVTGGETFQEIVARQGDVVVSRSVGVACGVRSADCGTLLIADRATGAVAAVHAGWRGTAAGVVGAAVRSLRALLSGEGDLIAAVGPHIERCCFEVGEDVAAELASASSAGDAAIDHSGERPHVDLRRILESHLLEQGIAAPNIDHVRGCTVCEQSDFFSYRRDGKASGRLLSAIVAR